MPHCATWSESDWGFAFECAELHARFCLGGSVATASELRIRERVMGTTHDARLGLRIRYVEPRPALTAVPAVPDDYRDL
jgi:hypothetical protein